MTQYDNEKKHETNTSDFIETSQNSSESIED